MTHKDQLIRDLQEENRELKEQIVDIQTEIKAALYWMRHDIPDQNYAEEKLEGLLKISV